MQRERMHAYEFSDEERMRVLFNWYMTTCFVMQWNGKTHPIYVHGFLGRWVMGEDSEQSSSTSQALPEHGHVTSSSAGALNRPESTSVLYYNTAVGTGSRVSARGSVLCHRPEV